MNDINESQKIELNQTPNAQYLLNNETYENLKMAQEKIRNETEIVPKMRKIINDILNKENIELYIEQFLNRYKY